MKSAFILLLAVALAAGCKSVPPLPPADLSGAGWRVQHGQAVWKPGAQRAELAGDLLVATNANGRMFVQFVKDPFPLATAQAHRDRWQIDFAAGRRSWRGGGAPPNLFLWFQLPAALRGEKLKGSWKFFCSTDVWRIENPRRGEWLEGRFFE